MGVACGPRYPLIRLQALGTACTEALEVGRYTLLSLLLIPSVRYKCGQLRTESTSRTLAVSRKANIEHRMLNVE
jgi:hypothetical protein